MQRNHAAVQAKSGAAGLGAVKEGKAAPASLAVKLAVGSQAFSGAAASGPGAAASHPPLAAASSVPAASPGAVPADPEPSVSRSTAAAASHSRSLPPAGPMALAAGSKRASASDDAGAARRCVTEDAAGHVKPCVVCMERPVAAVFLECGHVACCVQCAQPMKNCPTCHASITRVVQISRP